jgi:hypothetical protein
MAKDFSVAIPICGYAIVEVEADSPEDAIEKALAGEITIDDIESWEAIEHICEGNCFNGSLNDAEAEEI